MLLIVSGPPCTGKSTIGNILESRLGFTHLEMDQIRQRVLPESDQRQEHRDIGYRAMHLLAERLLRGQESVIVNATYNRELHRRELVSMSRLIEGACVLIQCKAPREVVLKRFHSRPEGHAAVDLTEALVVDLWTNYAYSRDGIIVDTSNPLDVCLTEIQNHVKSGGSDSLDRWVKMQ